MEQAPGTTGIIQGSQNRIRLLPELLAGQFAGRRAGGGKTLLGPSTSFSIGLGKAAHQSEFAGWSRNARDIGGNGGLPQDHKARGLDRLEKSTFNDPTGALR
jgi:hypothetical protein